MIWIIVSVPLWFFGGLSFTLGVYAICKVASLPGDVQAFESIDDGGAVIFGAVMVGASALPLYLAAKLVA